MGLTSTTRDRVRREVAAWPAEAGKNELFTLLHLMARWRSQMLANTYLEQQGTIVFGGPFAGMDYVSVSAEGALIPRLIGSYEAELHPHFRAILDSGVDCLIDVGCAEGYYAVGLARIAPGLEVRAHDINPTARIGCQALATRNGVSDRVIVGGEFVPEDFQGFAGRRVLVLVDTEGAELDILQPERAPALAGMNIIVETHDHARPGALRTLVQRFAATHDIVRVDQGPRTADLPHWFKELGHIDQLLAVWEWRSVPTPWLVMRPKV